MSAPVDSLSIKVDASARGANQQLDKLVQKMIQLRSSVNSIKVGNLNTMAASIQNFSKAASGLSQVKTSDFTRMAKSIEKLSNIRKGELNRAATAITNISKEFSNIGNVSDGANKIAQLAQGISKLGYKSTTQAIQNIPLLTNELKNMMSELSKAPTVSNNIIAMTNAMANLGAQASGIRSLGSAMNGAGRSGNGFFGTMKKGISSIKNFASNVRSATTHNRSFASTIGLLYAKLFILKRAFDAFGSAVKSSMDYIEEYNYFNVTMEKIASEWSDDFKKYGYENADEYGKSFQRRLTETMNKMTGFKMNNDGTLTDSGIKNLGLDVTQMANYAAGVAQVTNSVGLTGEASVVTSKALSMLAGDMSSFRNLDMSTVMNNFSSGLIGQSRALYKYGIDITNATLATYAHEMGIKKDISAMTQGEKMQLRMIAILDQSKVAWGDLAKTINSPSNQLRLLQNNFKALSRTIGNMFLPVVAKVLPYVNGLVIAIRRLFEWTASMLGIDLKDVIGNSGGGYSDMFDGIEEDANNASDAVDDTTDSVKKLAKQLMGFDELNVITTNKGGNSKDDDKDSAPIDLTNQLSAALADYEKVWNDAYANMTNDAEKFADKLTKLFKDAWISGDGSDIGSAIAKWLNKGIDWINKNWSVADEKVQKIANILATAVNGFTYEFDWSGLGTALSNTLQTWLNGETTFFDNTDWTSLGEGIATSLNSFIGNGKNGPIQSYFKNIGSKLRAAIEFAFGTITTFKFDNLGKAIGQGINDFFEKMGKVDKKTGLNGWQELAVTISEGIKGISTTITTALGEVDWEDVGQAIADFITGIDWDEVIWSLGDVVKSFADALKKILKGAGMNDTLANLVVNVGIGGWIIKKLSKTALGEAISKKLGSKFSTTLKKVGASIKDWIVNSWNKSKLKSKIENKISGIKTAIKNAGASVKNWVIDKWNESALKAKLSEKVQGISTTIKNAVASVKKWIVDATSKLKAKLVMQGAVPSTVNKPVVNVNIGKIKTIGNTKTLSLPGTTEVTGKWKFKGIITALKNVFADTINIGNISLSVGSITGLAGIFATLGAEAGRYNDDFESVGNDIGTNIKNGIIDAVKFLTFYDLVSAINDGLNGSGSSENAVNSILKGADGALTKLQEAFNGVMEMPIKIQNFTFETDEESGKSKLQEAFNKFMTGGKDGTPSITALVKYLTDDSEVKKTNKKIKDKKITLTYKGQKTDAFIKYAKDYNALKSKNATVNMSVKKSTSLTDVLKNPLLSNIGKQKTLTQKINLDISILKNGNSADRSLANLLENISKAGKKAGGGIFSGGSWHNIARYASGGLPGMGQMFVAREAGPELVGTIGGHTAVMNNNQIVASVSDGVFNALAPVLTQVVNSINALNSKVDSMSGGMNVEKYTEGDLLRVVRKEDNNYRKRTGKSAFAY